MPFRDPFWERTVRVYGALLKMDEEPAENLWERIKQQYGVDKTVGSVCYGLPAQGSSRWCQKKPQVHRQALILVVDFSYPDSCRAFRNPGSAWKAPDEYFLIEKSVR